VTLETRKHAELEAKCNAFEAELQQWRGAVSSLPQHTTQITRLTALFAPLASGVRAQIRRRAAGDIVARAFDLSAEVLMLFRAWAFYRQKLDQRFVPWQREFLEVADDLAYRWWKPARDAALAVAVRKASVAKEPPLVFLNGDVSPFTITRRTGFTVEEAGGLDPAEVAWSAKLLRLSPVPVVGVPYFAARHIPDLMVIAHEVGHNVEDDFRLKDDLEAAVARALKKETDDEARHPAWKAWLGEIFADAWGVLSAGPAFVDALTDFVADSPSAIESEWRPKGWGLYPTVALRVRIVLATLRALDLEADADARWTALRPRCGKHRLPEYEPDVDVVVRAILECKPASLGCSVRQASSFDAADQQRIKPLAADLARGYVAGETNTALLAQGIALAFGIDPAKVASPQRTDALWKGLRGTVTKGVRSSHAAALPLRDLEKNDAETAAELMADLERKPDGGA
jgi:hypothetical protein